MTHRDDPPEEFVNASVRMRRSLHTRLAALAESEHRSLSAQILAMVERDLAKTDPPKETQNQ